MPEFELVGSSIARICHLQTYLHNYFTFTEPSSDLDNDQDCSNLDCSLTHLSTQIAVLHNAIVLILTGVIDENDLIDLLIDPTGNHWKSPLVENKARVGLGKNYDMFFNRMSRLHVHLNVIFEVFKLHTRASIKDQSSLRCLESNTNHKLQPDLSGLKLEKILAALEDINNALYLIADSFITAA